MYERIYTRKLNLSYCDAGTRSNGSSRQSVYEKKVMNGFSDGICITSVSIYDGKLIPSCNIVSCYGSMHAAYRYSREEHVRDEMADLEFFGALMARNDVDDARYGPTTRRQRNMDAWMRGLPATDPRAVVDPQIEGNCNAILIDWFHRDITVVFHMNEANEDYLLEHGSLWIEIYVCLVRLLSLDEFEDWYVRGLYWTRALYCLHLLHSGGCITAGRFFDRLLHFVGVEGLFDDCQTIIARQVDLFLNERGINLAEEG
eukprot:GHVU01062841.1.p1 GENE.GHVU01062841.1~~GHVU01062841.1.p1  ORF type:complete len:258 (-),score=7.33 GHVU01062841.1:163-936(-)